MNRDKPRFRAMFRRRYPQVLGYALRRASEADAHDAVSETFLIAWRRRRELPPTDAELPWLLGVARRVLANQRRARARADRLVLRLAHDQPAAREQESTPRVLEAVARLRPLDREVLLLTAWDALSHRQVAAMFGCSENAVAIRAHRARLRLTEELGRELSASGGREE